MTTLSRTDARLNTRNNKGKIQGRIKILQQNTKAGYTPKNISDKGHIPKSGHNARRKVDELTKE
jgi:hypothetical protein